MRSLKCRKKKEKLQKYYYLKIISPVEKKYKQKALKKKIKLDEKKKKSKFNNVSKFVRIITLSHNSCYI